MQLSSNMRTRVRFLHAPAWMAAGACGVILATLATAQNVPYVNPADGKAAATEAPTGFDNLTNGFQEKAQFKKDRESFEDVEKAEENGLGPIYNATSCVSCHQNPVTGAASQIAEIRSGRRVPDPNSPDPKKVVFEQPPGGSVIQQRAVDPSIQETVPPEDDVRTFRLSTNILGDGFVEVLTDRQILDLRKEQRKLGMEGFPVIVEVPVRRLDMGEKLPRFRFVERVGRFGWKCQHASLLGFAADAYLNEMGITSPLQPEELTSLGRSVKDFDHKEDPEDEANDNDAMKTPRPFGKDVEAFTRFMRSTKASPRDPSAASNPNVAAGEALFRNNAKLGCAVCHHPDFTTPAAGSEIVSIHGGRGSDLAKVPDALGNKVIHPYGDFMLHDIGTGDGIAQTDHIGLRPRNESRDVERLTEAVRREEGIGRVQGEAVESTQGRAPRLRGVADTAVESAAPSLDQRTANKMRTAPLWGLRTRPHLMHDGLSLTIEDAIRRHHGQADGVRLKFEALSDAEEKQLLDFLKSL